MTDEELIARLRSGLIGVDVDKQSADRIEALQKALKDQSSVSDRLAEQLATCEKYRDAYAECDRIGTQAVRDLEAKLAKAVGLLGKSLVKEKRDLSSTLYEEISDFIEEIAEIKGESHE